MNPEYSKARATILARIRVGKPKAEPVPKIPEYIWEGDAVENFINALEGFDGKAVKFASRQDAIDWLRSNVNVDGKVVCSQVKEFQGNRVPTDYPDPRKCSEIDATVVESPLGVGEMGSLFLSDRELGKPACGLLCNELFVLIDKRRIVDGMHTAYSQLVDVIRGRAYASFFTGPSATADIEAVHVTGAQGPTALTALIY